MNLLDIINIMTFASPERKLEPKNHTECSITKLKTSQTEHESRETGDLDRSSRPMTILDCLTGTGTRKEEEMKQELKKDE